MFEMKAEAGYKPIVFYQDQSADYWGLIAIHNAI
jgi:hypothetical protein